jgi:hypothetical protein
VANLLTPHPNADGYLRFWTRRASFRRGAYAHRVYADRQMRESLGRGLREGEEIHHLCRNRACWPPTDFHLLILDEKLHHAFEAGKKPNEQYRKRKAKELGQS